MMFGRWECVVLILSIFSNGQFYDGLVYGQSASESLQQLEADYWAWRMKQAPVMSSVVGETQYNDRLESYALGVYDQRKTGVVGFKNKLSQIDRTQLDQAGQLDYDILTDFLQTFIDGAQYNDFFPLNPVNFLEDVNSDPGHLEVVVTFNNVGDFENYLHRLNKMPKQINEKIELLRKAVSLMHTLNNVSVAAVPSQLDAIISVPIDQSPLYSPAFTTNLDQSHVSTSKRVSLRRRAWEAVKLINDGLTRLKSYLINEYMPHTRSSWGIEAWPGSLAIYQQCLRYHTTTDMTPQEIHDLGLQEVARITANMQQALKRLNFQGTVRQFFEKVKSDPQFYKKNGDEIIATYKDYIYQRIFPKLHTLFKDIPKLPLEVRPMATDGPGGLYLAGTPSGSVPGIFYANVMHPNETVTINMMSLVLHETVPGHHLQAIYTMTSNIPKYRAFVEDDHYYRMPAMFPLYTAYVEGWALYSEFLGEELGVYTDDYMLMGRYSDEIFRACRLVVDTGLHAFGWERERAIDYMVEHTAESRQGMETEIDRYLTWPGQATAYKIGEIKIKSLRQKATNQLGNKFNVKDFHSLMLDSGGMPLNLLERNVDQWIASQQTHDNLIG